MAKDKPIKEILAKEDAILEAKTTTPLVIISCLFILVSFYFGLTFSKNIYLVATTVGLIIIFGITNYIPKLKFSQKHIPYLISYHLALAFVLIFIMPTISYFIVFWILLAYLSEYFYQTKGLAVSLVALFATLAAGLYVQNNFNFESLVTYVQWFIIIGGASLVFNRIILGTKEVRKNLAEKTTRAEYEHQRLLALINSMAEAVLSVDEEGIINMYNSAALDILNTHSDLNNKKIQGLIELLDNEDNPIDVMEVVRETKYISKKTEYHIKRSDKEIIMLEINISKAGSTTPINHQTGYTILLRDITKQKSLEEERQDFISVVSHELRTPITVAEANVSMAELIYKREHFSDQKTLDSLQKAHEKILFLSDMVNDLSTLSRAERQDKEMDIETFQISEIIKEVIDLTEDKAKQKSINLETEVQSKISDITTSKLYLKEILQNFVTNAIKYSNKGPILISATKNNNGKIRLAVKDHGAGLSEADKQKVFDKFWRSENPLTRETEGTGLGLYISSKLARRINAEIGLESKLGYGSTFYLDLPALATQKIDQSNVVKNEARNILG